MWLEIGVSVSHCSGVRTRNNSVLHGSQNQTRQGVFLNPLP